AGAAGDALPAIRQPVGNRVVAIDLTRAVAELLRQSHAAFDVLRPDAGPKSIGRTVRQLERFLGRCHGAHSRERVEDLLRVDVYPRLGGVGRRLQIKTILSGSCRFATRQERLATAGDGFLLGLQDAAALGRVNHGTKLRARFRLMADLETAKELALGI